MVTVAEFDPPASDPGLRDRAEAEDPTALVVVWEASPRCQAVVSILATGLDARTVRLHSEAEVPTLSLHQGSHEVGLVALLGRRETGLE